MLYTWIMKKIYTWSSKEAYRNLTLKDLINNKRKKRFSQITVRNQNDVNVAVQSNVDILITNSQNIDLIRNYDNSKFLIGSIKWEKFTTQDDILKEAISSLEKGADAVITQRSFKIIEYLANENIPVMGHLGLIPRQSSWLGGMRVVGKQYDEAKMLLDKFIDLENAGAFGVECELIPHDLMELISSKTNLVTSSLGSGNSCDIIFSFIEDICGENEKSPKHGKKYCDVFKMNKEIENLRIKAVTEYVNDINLNKYYDSTNKIQMDKNDFLRIKKNDG